jgi:hypothetical protein
MFTSEKFKYDATKAAYISVCKNCVKKDPVRKFQEIKSKAKSRGIDFYEGDKEKLLVKLLEPCFYCSYLNPQGYAQGLDRVDKGYSDENTVPACKLCNMIKYDLTVEDFLEHVGQICCRFPRTLSEIPKERNDVVYDESIKEFGSTQVPNLNPLRRKSDNKTLTDLRRLGERECYICGTVNNVQLDRIDSSQGYTMENVQSCCGTCNHMKKDLDLNRFLLHCEIIYIHNRLDCVLLKDYQSPRIEKFKMKRLL